MNKKNIFKILKKSAGWFLIVVGIIGIAIPLFPDILFIIIGSSLLGSKAVNNYFENVRAKITNKFTRRNKAKLL